MAIQKLTQSDAYDALNETHLLLEQARRTVEQAMTSLLHDTPMPELSATVDGLKLARRRTNAARYLLGQDKE